MTNAVVKVENINGVLVTTSNRVAEELGVEHKNLIAKIDGYSKQFSSAKLLAQFYIPSDYKTKNGRTTRNYLITEKGIAQLVGGYSGAVEVAFKLNVAYINEFDRMKNALQSIGEKERLLLGLFSQDAMTVAESHKKLVELETKPLIEKLEYKQEVINGMTDDIKLQTQRQYLNKIVRMGQRQGESIQARWSMLYNFYETHKHINLSARVEGYKRANGVKNITKLEYIDRQGDIPLLYSIAVKLFESDFKKSLKNYLEIL